MTHTILLIEDDPLSARLADLLLTSEGYTVIHSSNGLKGLQIALDSPPDLILLDLMLPGLDGFEVLNRLRAEPQTAQVPVVIVSSKSQPTDKDTATKIGANDYVTKPYRKDQLLALVKSLISESQQAVSAATGVLLVGGRGDEGTPVAMNLGLALAARDKIATVVDLRPLSIEGATLLNVAPCTPPISLSNPETASTLVGLTVQHSGGLRLLNNLEGSGDAGQLTPQDVEAALDVLLAEGDFVLLDAPLYPIDIFKSAAGRCARVILVVRSDVQSLTAARSTLTMMSRANVDAGQISIILVGPPPESDVSDLGQVLGTVPPEAGSDDPVFEELVGYLQDLT